MDFTKLKKLTIGGVELVNLFVNGIQVWAMKTFTNQVPISTDTDGSIFNGTGYKENVRLSSSGGISSSAQNGSVTTGFIPFYGDSTVIRMKGVQWINAVAANGGIGHFYLMFYDSGKQKMEYLASYDLELYAHIATAVRDANGVETVTFNTEYGDTNTMLNAIRKASFIRITAYGKGADMIVTINEEITE